MPTSTGKDDQSIHEKFVVTMHDRCSATDSIDEVKLVLFALKQRLHDSTPSPPQHKHLSFNILSVLNTKQFAYGDKQLSYVKWKTKDLRNGVRRSKMTSGKSSANCTELPTAFEVWLQD